jgi:hypothetical protein
VLFGSYRRVATSVDKILKGAKPAEIPIEQPTNQARCDLRNAKNIGLTTRPNVLARAEQSQQINLCVPAANAAPGEIMSLKLTMTCTAYDRNQALLNGTVKPGGSITKVDSFG